MGGRESGVEDMAWSFAVENYERGWASVARSPSLLVFPLIVSDCPNNKSQACGQETQRWRGVKSVKMHSLNALPRA